MREALVVIGSHTRIYLVLVEDTLRRAWILGFISGLYDAILDTIIGDGWDYVTRLICLRIFFTVTSGDSVGFC
jgi:hypothetical protein